MSVGFTRSLDWIVEHRWAPPGCDCKGKRCLLLRGSTLAVARYLAHQSNHWGWCWASSATIERNTGVGPSTRKEALAKLEAHGLIRRHYRAFPGRSGTRSVNLWGTITELRWAPRWDGRGDGRLNVAKRSRSKLDRSLDDLVGGLIEEPARWAEPPPLAEVYAWWSLVPDGAAELLQTGQTDRFTPWEPDTPPMPESGAVTRGNDAKSGPLEIRSDGRDPPDSGVDGVDQGERGEVRPSLGPLSALSRPQIPLGPLLDPTKTTRPPMSRGLPETTAANASNDGELAAGRMRNPTHDELETRRAAKVAADRAALEAWAAGETTDPTDPDQRAARLAERARARTNGDHPT